MDDLLSCGKRGEGGKVVRKKNRTSFYERHKDEKKYPFLKSESILRKSTYYGNVIESKGL